eukprot:m.418174 g.418174  ORF g.418174 m.418174 type:complete len:198 (+) comp30784_c0_seq1:87-680(+)
MSIYPDHPPGAAAQPPQISMPHGLNPGLSAAAPMAAVPVIGSGDKRPAHVMGDHETPMSDAKRPTPMNYGDDTRVKVLLKGLGANLAAADKQYKELYAILLGETAVMPKGPIGRVPHISPTPPPDAIVIGTEGFVARYTSLGGTSKLEFWDSRQGTGTKLKFIDGTDLVIMGTFTKKATLCEILPAKEVEAALQKRH